MCNQIERKRPERRIESYLTVGECHTRYDEMVKRANRPYVSEEHDEYQAALLEFAESLSDD